jgi:hypothetical protein
MGSFRPYDVRILFGARVNDERYSSNQGIGWSRLYIFETYVNFQYSLIDALSRHHETHPPQLRNIAEQPPFMGGFSLPSVILNPADHEEWLLRVDGENPPVHLLRPFHADEMKAKEAHKDVGNVRNNHPELLNSA